jgi:hypothetical protein
VAQAMRTALSGRPGPVHLRFLWMCWVRRSARSRPSRGPVSPPGARSENRPPGMRDLSVHRVLPSRNRSCRSSFPASQCFHPDAPRRRGIRDGSPGIQKSSERLGAPVVTTTAEREFSPKSSRSPWHTSAFSSVRNAVEEADVLFAVGTELAPRISGRLRFARWGISFVSIPILRRSRATFRPHFP